MDMRRLVLYAALTLVSLSLWNSWQIDYPAKSQPLSTSVNEASPNNPLPEPSYANPQQPRPETPALYSTHDVSLKQRLVSVKTDVLDVVIDLNQGDIVQAQLLDYPLSTEEKNKPFILLKNGAEQRYVANSSLFTVEKQTIQPVDIAFKTAQPNYQLSADDKNLTVVLDGENNQGLMIKKKFTFSKGSYLIDMAYEINNHSNEPWVGYLNTQLLRSSPQEDKSSIFHVGSYTGASYSNPQKTHYQKVSFTDMTKTNLDFDAQGGWVAMQQHYFLSAWIPNAISHNKFYTRANHGDYTIGLVSQPVTVKSDETKEIGSQLYIGPEITSVLQGIAPHLDLTIDYGILWFLSSLLFSLMKAIYTLIGNWGWSIVLVTVLIKLAFYRLSATSYKSMAGMRKLQPKLQSLRERYGDDKAKLSQATMELYKQEKVNPLGGCLPIVIQIPVFIALYWVLLESVELRQAPFIFWIKDLASPDPYHVLPLIMGATMMVQQKLNPAPPDPVQAKVMMFLPILFTGLFWNFPAGLVLYWIVNNTLSIGQQWYITRKYSDDKIVKKLATTTK